MKLLNVELCGVTPLLIHRFGEQSEVSKNSRKIQITSVDPREEATRNAYIAPDGTFFFSAFAIPNTMGGAGANHKSRGSRRSLRFVVPSAVRMLSDAVTILGVDRKPATGFEVDSRPVTIPATKGRIMRHRPRFNVWFAVFQFNLDDSLLDLDTAHQLLNEAGTMIGIGDFRPEKRGPFGTFRVTRFEEAK